ncbi:MAG: addiction module protein [Marinilabiliaceae bacterium]|nr:addiction module protein [Marinilabiliaceae bacterium]
MTKLLDDILKLSVLERIGMLEAIWDSITEEEKNLYIPEEIKLLLNERLEAYGKAPEKTSNWDEVKKRINKQL